MENLILIPVDQLSDTELSDVANYLNEQYRIDNRLVPDEVFDLVYIPALEARLPQHPLLTEVQPEVFVSSKGEIAHPVPMLSTDKAYTRQVVQKWLNRVLKQATLLGIAHDDVMLDASPKFDGIAGRRVVASDQLVSRGTGLLGNDISHMSKGLVIVGNPDSDSIGEVVMKNKHFEANFTKAILGEKNGYVDSRAFIAGIANSDTLKEQGKIALDNGFVELIVYADLDKISCRATDFMDSYEEIEATLLESEYLLDGVIFDVRNNDIRVAMGATSHHPLWRLAKKQVKDAKLVELIDILWQVGRTQAITPVLKIPPTLLPVVTVTSITGHSLGYLKKHGLGIGATFMAHRAGSVIPAWLETIEAADVDYPKFCPCCESPTEIRMGLDKDNEPCEHLRCSNKQCTGSNVSALFHAFKRLNIDLFGPKSCEKLVSQHINTVAKIIVMSQNDFINAGFGDGESANFIKEIARAKAEPLPDAHLLASLGINLLGRGRSEKLLKNHKIDTLLSLTYDELLNVENFAEITATAVFNGLIEQREALEFLLAQGFNLTHTSETNVVTDKDNGLAGLNICFTGTMVQGNRNDMKADAKSKGAKVQSSVNGKTNLLVIGEGVGDKKLNSATELGVEIITEKVYNERFTTR
jgi:DNA ligase (NAD+)